jgi:transposase-like protein
MGMHSSGSFVRVDGWAFNGEGRPLECLKCGGWEFYDYAGYTRHPVTLKGRVDQPVVRYQCRSCRKTIVQTFDYVGKWKQYAKDVHRTALNRIVRDRSSRRHASRSLKDDFQASPCESTLRNWANLYGKLSRIVLTREVFPRLNLSGYQPVHMDEIYTHVAGKKMAIMDAMAHKGYLSLGGKVCNDPSSDDVYDVLEQMDDLLIEPSSFVTDDSAIYPPAFSRLGRRVVHRTCVFHRLRTIGRWEKALAKTKNKRERKDILENIIRNFKELFDQIWDDPHGRVTNNRLERRFAEVRRMLHQSVGFMCLECADRFQWLERFRWDFHRFERGRYSGRSPVEVCGFQTDGHEWTYFLGIPDRQDLEAMIESLACLLSQLFAS